MPAYKRERQPKCEQASEEQQQEHLARPMDRRCVQGFKGMVETFENHGWAAATFYRDAAYRIS